MSLYRRTGMIFLGLLFIALPAQAATMSVYKTATCGCCAAWVEHVRAAGFAVEVTDMEQSRLNEEKQRLGVDRRLASCHTARIEGYVIEGHVPAADIRRLLDEGPDIAGLAVPGMPQGSPGMDYGDRVESYNVIAFDEAGGMRVFSRHGRD